MKRACSNEYNLNINIKTVKVVSKWRANGTIQNIYKGHSGRSKRVRPKENIVILNDRIQENPSVGVRKLAAEVGISSQSARRILKVDLRQNSYFMLTHHSSSRTQWKITVLSKD